LIDRLNRGRCSSDTGGRYATEEEMRMVMEVLKESGLSQKAFAEREGIPFSVVQYWRRRLKQLDRVKTKAAKPKSEFVPVKIVERACVATEPFELRIGDDIALSVPPESDDESLRRLVSVLRSC
jgi:hypothetical protein